MKSIDRYMARLIAVPLFSNLLVTALLLVIDQMRRLFAFVTTEGGPVDVVWKMLANLLPEYLGLGIPIGLMLGVLLAFRRLATSSELDVMRAVGLSYTRLLRVPYMFAVLLALINFTVVGFVQPKARYAYERLRFELRSGALGASIKVGEFTQLGSKMTLRIEQSHEQGRKLQGIYVHFESAPGKWLDATADRGQFLATDDPDTIIFRLTHGTLVHNEPNFVTPRVLTFTSHDLPIPLPKYENFRGRGERNLERTLPELVTLGHDPGQTVATRDTSRAAFHFRMVEVVSMFLLPLLAVALAVPPKRSSSALGIFLAVVMVVAFHKVNEYGQALSGLGKVNPILALWGSFTIFAAIILWMYYTLAYVPGGQPIGALERVFAKVSRLVVKLLPRRRHRRGAIQPA